jgi:hypothetical protein
MKSKSLFFNAIILSVFALTIFSCNNKTKDKEIKEDTLMLSENQKEVNKYVSYKLTTDLSVLTEKEKQMLPLLFEAAEIMDKLYWEVAYGECIETICKDMDEATKQLFHINYGPWNRLDGNKAFIDSVGEKPAGAKFYPEDMTDDEFEAFKDDTKTSLYTIIQRDEAGKLISIPYHEVFKEELTKASEILKKAAELAEDEGLKKYLELRAEALVTSDYYASDVAWMEMKTNTIDFIIGPIENYEDALYGYKTAFESFILIKDKEWSKKLEKYASMLPDLQKQLPVEEKYKKASPGADSELNAYDAIYYAGDCNAGSKTIAINLPNDEKVQEAKGSRRLQLKNSMKAKFDNILVPIADVLITKDQLQYIDFDAFFANTMFHEVAHGLGVKYVITKPELTCREALENTYSTLEEGKADILGLWLVTKLNEKGEYEGDLMKNYVTFAAGIFRSVRFGASSSHGKANLITFNYFVEQGATVKNEDGTYTVDFEKMKVAVEGLAAIIIKIQGDGDIEAAKKLIEEKNIIHPELEKDLQSLTDKNIPVDIVWEQGLDILGL